MGLDDELWDILEEVFVTWLLMKKELLLIERNTPLLKRNFTRSITR